MNRAGFLLSGVRGSAAVAMGAIGAGLLVESADAAEPAPATTSDALTDLDLAFARLAVGVEILSVGFYTEAIATRRFAGDTGKALKRALFNEGEHLTAMSQLLSGAGQTPSTTDDFSITFPKGTFDSRGSIARLGLVLETAALGAYLGTVDSASQSDLRTTAARIAANEAQHESVFSALTSNRALGISFPEPVGLETASDLLDAYLS